MRFLYVLTPTVALLASCSSSSHPAADAAAPRLIASVAASATEAMEQLGQQFRAQSGVEVKVNGGPSNGLSTQILAGAPADVFLSASSQWADKLDETGLVSERVDLLTNRLVVVVPRGNPAAIHRPEDLATPAVKKLALAGESVPAGIYADHALGKLGLLDELNQAGKIVRGQDVRAALSFVERGEAEAGVVYATDLAAAKDVEIACEFDPALHDEIVYVLVLVKQQPVRPEARRFYEFVQGDAGKVEFAKRGFIPLTAASPH